MIHEGSKAKRRHFTRNCGLLVLYEESSLYSYLPWGLLCAVQTDRTLCSMYKSPINLSSPRQIQFECLYCYFVRSLPLKNPTSKFSSEILPFCFGPFIYTGTRVQYTVALRVLCILCMIYMMIMIYCIIYYIIYYGYYKILL